MAAVKPNIAIIGGGPAGLMAAEVLASGGAAVTVYDRMPNPGRKFLLAGRGGLNLTHGTLLPAFLAAYGATAPRLAQAITAFPPTALTAWCNDLGEPTFTGTSGRIFPRSLKASPLLRAWLGRLAQLGVAFERSVAWMGWDADGGLILKRRSGDRMEVRADAVVLALGGASWPRLGADGGWVPLLQARGITVAPLTAANCGIAIEWSAIFRKKFAGEPLKRVAFSVAGHSVRGEGMVTAHGLEGGAVYQLVPALRAALTGGQPCAIKLDLKPDQTVDQLTAQLEKPRGKQTLANHLRKVAGLAPVAIGLLREPSGPHLPATASELAQLIKSVPLVVNGLEPIDRAISSAGGIAWEELDANFMLHKLPGVFAAGEMLDWEAPTGGYLLQACFSTGVAAARGALAYVA